MIKQLVIWSAHDGSNILSLASLHSLPMGKMDEKKRADYYEDVLEKIGGNY
jgi:hypothetical protein